MAVVPVSDAPSPKKLQVYEQADTEFGTSPGGSARGKLHKVRKFCVDHLGVDTPSDEYLKELFAYFDQDGSGEIDKAEFRKVFCESFDNYGAPMTEKDADRYFVKLDKNNNGKLNFDEFAVLMLSRLKM